PRRCICEDKNHNVLRVSGTVSLDRLTLINGSPVSSGDLDLFAADASELYRHAEELVFLVLIVGGESILMHDDHRGTRCAARPRKLWQHLFDVCDEASFFARNVPHS